MSADDEKDEGEKAEGDREAPEGEASPPEDPTAGDAEPEAESEPEGDRAAEPTATRPAAPDPAKRRRISLWWLLPAAMVVEFWVYGHNGYIDVCVGKEGHTDFTLEGEARTDENRWKFPRCESRTNLGLRSHFDERVEEATKVACRGATLFRFQGEAKQCEAGEGGWKRQVKSRFCPPWDPAYYEHLFWFLQ
jgi:hypothetical protein